MAKLNMVKDYGSDLVRMELVRISQDNDGRLNPDAIVEAATPEDSPLHEFFTWDDNEAGKRLRRIEATFLIRRVRLSIIRATADQREVTFTAIRQFHSRPSMRLPDGGYEPIEAIMSDPIKRAELLEQALKELHALEKKYKELSELSALFDELHRLMGKEEVISA
jgi:hypothetical protein